MQRIVIISVLLSVVSMHGMAQSQQSLRESLLNEIARERTRLVHQPAASAASATDLSERLLRTDGMTADGSDYPVSEPIFIEAEVHAALDPQDESTMVVSAIRHVRRDGQIYDLSCPIYCTSDGGQSWTEAPFITGLSDPEGILAGGGDPVFAYSNNGRVYFTWLNFFYTADWAHLISELCWVYSDDGGYTWITPEKHIAVDADDTSPEFLDSFIDKQWIVCDQTSSQHSGNLYAAYVRVSFGTFSMRVRRKLAASAAFENVEAVISHDSLSIVQFASIAVDTEGGVHVIYIGSADEQNFFLWHATSQDGAATFSPARKLAPVIFPRFSKIDRYKLIRGLPADRMYPCPQLAADQLRSGHLYATWTATGVHASSDSGADIYFSRSTDFGASWSEPRIVNDDDPSQKCDQFYSSIATNRSGDLVLTWYDTREDTESVVGRYYTAVSKDGGIHFTKNQPLASQAMDFLVSQSKNDRFGIGEYNQVLLSEHAVLPFWADGRNNNGILQVYSVRIDLSTLSVQSHAPLLADFRILDVYPQPLPGAGRLRFSVDQTMTVQLQLSDVLGRTVWEAPERQYDAGEHTEVVSTTGLPSGSYYLRMNTPAGSTGRLLHILRP